MMKYLSLLICFLFCSSISIMAQAPSYTDFELDAAGVGLAIPIGDDDLGTGLLYGGEFRFNVTDFLSVGIGADLSVFDLKNLENLEDDEDATIGFSSTGFLSGDYYLSTTSPNRAFVGLAIGRTKIGDIEFTEAGEEVEVFEGESGMSLMPRLGYELGHVRILSYYNIGMSDGLSDHLVLKVSLTIWGGYQG